MDPRDFQQLAVKLSKSQIVGERRTAIGRAYFAAFNVAAIFLRGFGVIIEKKPEAHKIVPQYLSNSGDNEITKVAHKLETMRKMRNQADYDLDDPIPEDPRSVEIHLGIAKNFIETIDKCCVEVTRLAGVKAKVQKWREDNGYL